MDERDANDAVHQLTRMHTVRTPAGDIVRGPLLDWLAELITSQDGAGSGSGEIGLPINYRAFDCAEHIRRQLTLICTAYDYRPTGDWLTDTRKAWEKAHATWLLGNVEPAAWRRLVREFPDWVQRIEAQADKPRSMELTVPCPECGSRWREDADGSRTASVMIRYLPGQAPIAECHSDGCEALWVGWAALHTLGQSIGAEPDRRVLAACGIHLE